MPVATRPATLIVTPVGTDFSQVTAITHAGDARLFVGQRTGEIFVLNPDGSQQLYLDLSKTVLSGGSEYGLYDIAFHPDFAENGLFFVAYSGNEDDRVFLYLSRFKVDLNTGQVDPATQADLLRISQMTDLHKGGGLDFDTRNNLLYMGIGEDTEMALAQNPRSLKGKVMRLMVDQIPADATGNVEGLMTVEMWAMGFRNPWRVDVDEISGRVYIADVGSGSWEEVNAGPTGVVGANFGWPCYQGSFFFPPGDVVEACRANPTLISPLFSFSHDDGRCAIIGGSVYRPADNPDDGRYIFSDLCTRNVFALATGTVPANPAISLGVISDSAILTLGEDLAGNIYAGDSAPSGPIYRLTFPANNAPNQ